MRSVTNLKQKDWKKACRRLGLEVDTKSGKGSHIRVKNPNGGFRPLTIPCKTKKIMNLKLYESLVGWGFTEEEIDKALK